jgi:hypothetical protein
LLIGLGADDHVQYFRVDGARAMGANLNMGGFSITNVNLVDGIDPSAHGSRHAPGGVDAIPTASAVGLNAASVNAEGNAGSVARSNHTHAIEVGTATAAIAPNNTQGGGSSTSMARIDHSHTLPTAAPVATGTANAAGTADTTVRSDHVHRTEVALQKAGATAGARPTINFTGAGVTVTDDTVNDRINVSIVTVGAGDVLGPASSVDSTIALFDGVTGKLIKGSALSVTAGGDLDLGNKKVTSVATPTAATDAATKGYVDGRTHASLAGLGADDHVQYLLVDGTRAMGANLNMGGFSITNVNLVDGIDPSAHGSRHAPGGADAIPTAAASTLTASTTNTEGVALSVARSDHTHAITANVAASSLSATTTNTVGTSPAVARADHTHAIGTAAAVSLSATTTNTAGTAATMARSDHTHDMLTGGATATVAPNSTAVEGTSANLAREDHGHALPTAAPVATGTANSAGTANTTVRSDHVHRTEVAVQQGGTAVSSRPTINFVGPIVTVTEDIPNDRVTVTIIGGTGSGDVTGPASATDSAVALFDGATGKILKNSPFTLSGTNLSLGSNKLVDVATPTAATDAATKGYVDGKVYDHGGLTGLGDDDHVQYLLVDGTRAMGANLNMGGFSITNVNLVDGIDPSTHGSRHAPDGADAIPTASAVSISATTANAEGVATSVARSDHTHAIGTAAAVSLSATTTNTAGVSANLARSDHTHAISTAAAVSLSATTTNTAGTAATMARSDHTHDMLTGGATVAITPNATAGEGTSANLAREDHSHTLPTAAPVATGTANSAGTANTTVRSDHVHRTLIGLQKDATAVASRPTINVIGGAVTVADDGVNDRINITVASDVVGPASSTANAIVMFDGITGKLLAQSPFRVISGNLSVESAKIVNVANPTVGTDAANKAYVDAVAASVDHGGLLGLGDDDHAQYLLVSGTRAMTGALNMGTNKVTNVATPTVAADAANKAYVDDVYTYVDGAIAAIDHGTLLGLGDDDHAQYLLVSGTRAMTGALNMGTNKITSVAAPTVATDAANKAYVDGLLSTADAPVNVTKAAAAIGVATVAARADHKHDVSTAAPVTLGTANSEGTAASLARSDHTHAHGAQTDGTLHAVATTSVAGFLSAADKTKLDGIATGATATPLASTAPIAVTKAAAVVGVATEAARADHKHDVSTAAPVAATPNAAAAEGTATTLARSDHVHAMTAAAPVAIGTANAAGSASTFVRSDHVHAHGAQTDGTLHAVATTSVAGFLSAADKTKLDGIATGAAALASTAPADITKAAAVIGVGTTAARADHKHDVSTAAPTTGIGAGNSEGTATTLARSDHSHALRIGASDVTFGSVADGQFLSLSGTSIVGADPQHIQTWKRPVRLCASSDITLSGTQTIDAIAAVVGDRVLVRGQTTGSQNGIYVVSATAWTRAVDFDADAEVVPGLVMRVSEGTVHGNSLWALSNTGAVVVGTTALTFTPVGLSAGAPTSVTKSAASAGGAANASRSDHKHDVSTAAAVDLTDATNAEGVSVSLARADHTHSHGARGGGTLHAVATTSVAGFLSGADKTKLDGIATGATATPLTATAPVAVTKAAAVVGVSTEAARADHKHDVSTAAPVTLGTANSEGTATTLARSDHTHAHGAQTDGTLHAVATTSVAGFLSAADKTKLDGIATGATATPLSSTAPADVTKATAVVGVGTTAARADHKHDVATAAPAAATVGSTATEGTSTSLARADHVHAMTAAAPVAIGTANAAGSASTFVRSDHVHAHGAQTDGTLHAVATTSVAGFMSAADKVKLDGISGSGGSRQVHTVDVVAVNTVGTPPSGGLTIDGIVVTSERVLLVGQVDQKENGIWVVNTGGNWTRASDMDASDELVSGATVAVKNGASFRNSMWVLSSADPLTLGVSSLVFTQVADSYGGLRPVRVATTANGTLATAFAAGQTVDGVALALGDRILLKNQSTATENGIYVVNSSGAPTRASDFAVGSIVAGAFIVVQDGTANSDTAWVCTSASTAAIVGTSSLAFAKRSFPLTSTAPSNVAKATAAVGTSEEAARADHVHDINTAAPAAATAGATAVEGTASTLARSDHVHAMTVAAPVAIGTANAAGSASTFVRSDHVHAHGAQTDGTLHAVATTSVAGFLSAADKTKLDGIATGAAALAAVAPADVTKAAAAVGVATTAARSDHKHDVSTAAPAAATVGASAAEGTATSLARSDHVHAMTAAAPVAIGTANAAGSASTFVRSDHVHAHGAQTDGTLHAVATTSVAGFLSAADKTKLDGIATGATAITFGSVVATGTTLFDGSASTAARADHVHTVPFSVVNSALQLANAAVGVNNQRIADVADTPGNVINEKDAVNFNVFQAHPFKPDCLVATTANITLSGDQTIDGVNLAGQNARVLVKNQTATAENGIYLSSGGAWTRTRDLSANADLTWGICVVVRSGTVNGGTIWATTDATAPIGVIGMTFTKLGPSAGGGTVDFASVSAALAGATTAVGFNDERITAVGDPVTDTDAVNLDTFQRHPWKGTCRVATIADTTLSGTYTMDGVALAVGNRVLVKDQTVPSQNGVYVVAAGAWSRSSDTGSTLDFSTGAIVSITEGSANANTMWHCTNPSSVVVGTSAITWALLQQKPITSGTAAPTGGVDGDIYLQFL